MIIEKTCEDKYSRDTMFDYVNADQHELTVTITLAEYRDLIETKCKHENQAEKLKWYEEYDRRIKAEARVKELEAEVNTLKSMMVCPKMEAATE